MAKDPAMLWYWNDWYSGTTLLSRFLKGCYMDILHAQFNNGRLSLEEIKTCLGADFGSSWPALQKKFKQDEQGLFFNERLEVEKEKRKAYTDSRSKNRSSKKTYDATYEKHMIPHMENRNENRNEIEKTEENDKFSQFPKCEDLGDLPELIVGSCVELVRLTTYKPVSDNQIRGLWKVFKTQNMTGKKFYQSLADVHSHFMNWVKKQDFTSVPTTNKEQREADRLLQKLRG